MGQGSRVMGHRLSHESWVIGHGSLVTGYCSRFMSHGLWVTGHESRVTVHGSRVTGHESRFMGHGSWVTGYGSRFMSHGSSDITGILAQMIDDPSTCPLPYYRAPNTDD